MSGTDLCAASPRRVREGSDDGHLLMITMMLVFVVSVMIAGLAQYTMTVVRTRPGLEERTSVIESAKSSMRVAIMMQRSKGPDGCIQQSSYPIGTFDTNGFATSVQCTELDYVDTGRNRYGVITTQLDPTKGGLTGWAGGVPAGSSYLKDVHGDVFSNGGDLTSYTGDILVAGTATDPTKIEYTNSVETAPGFTGTPVAPVTERYRFGADPPVACGAAVTGADGYPSAQSQVDPTSSYTHQHPPCLSSAPWWERAGDDTSPLDGADSWRYPSLPPIPTYDRDGKYIDLTSTCRMFYPGRYEDPLTLSGAGKEFYFASGVYYFTDTLTISNGAKVVLGAGRIGGCAVDADLALHPSALTNHSITGNGATLLLGGAAKVSVENSALLINRRISTPGTRGSEGVAIRSVNFGTSTATLQIPRDRVQKDDYLCVESSPGVCTVPRTPDLASDNSIDVGAEYASLPPSSTYPYVGSTLAPTDTALLLDFSGTTSQSQSQFETDGYVFVPNAQVVLKTPTSGSNQRSYKFLARAGIVASAVQLDAKELPATPATNWFVGLESQPVQLRVSLVVRTVGPRGLGGVSRAIVEVRANGAYAINSWTVDADTDIPAVTVDQGARPVAGVNGHAVTVSWQASRTSNNQAVDGYIIKRYSGAAPQTVLSSCTGMLSATNCLESAVPDGTWTYTVTPWSSLYGTGPESANSLVVTVGSTLPVAVADSYALGEDSPLTVAAPGVLGNDSVPSGSPMTAVLVSGVANGTLTFGSNGGFTYTPNANFAGTDSFTYKATTSTFDSSVVTVTLTVSATNDAPVNSVPGPQQTARNTNRVFSTTYNNRISISDSDAGGANVQVRLTATNGTVTLPVLTGLTFTIGDGTSDTSMTFTGTITNINLRLAGATFIPTNNYSGAATLQIVTSDLGNTGTGGTLTDSDTITVNVNSLGIFTANQDIGGPGQAGSSTYSAGTYTVNGSGADIWGNADQLQYLYRALTGDGRLTARVVSSTQTIGDSAAAKAGVMFRESVGAGSKHALMNIMKSAGSEFLWRPATNGPTSANGTTGIGAPVTPYWVRITRVGDAITAQRSPDGVTWTTQGTPQTVAMNATITVGLAVTAHDNAKLSTATFDNVALTTPPTAVADAYTTNEDTTLDIAVPGVLANDTDPESDTLTATLVTGTTGLTLNSNGSFTYVPPANFNGSTSFTYKANDGVFDSNTITVNITVEPANETPSFTKGADQSVLLGSAAQTVATWATAISQGTGETGQLINFIVTNNNNSLFSVQPAISSTGKLTYTPAPGVTGVATVSVSIRDNGGTANGGVDTSAAQTFTITVVPTTPVVTTTAAALAYTENAAAVAVDAGVTVTDANSANLVGATVTLTTNYVNGQDVLAFTNQNGITGTWTAATGALSLSGTATVANYQAALRSITYSNSSNVFATTSRTATFVASDGTPGNTATRQIMVTAVNDAPVNSVPGAQSTAANTAKVFSSGNGNAISIADADVAAGSMQVQLVSTNGTTTLSTLTGLTFSVGDGTADATMTFTGTVTNVNAALAGSSFTPTPGFGTASLQIVTSDQGNTGAGGTLTDNDTVAITVVEDLGIFTAHQDIGGPNIAGSSWHSAGTYTMSGSGADVWAVPDQFQYLYMPLTGDGRLTARVVTVTNPDSGAKAGVMFRDTLAPGSVHANMNFTAAQGTEFVYRAVDSQTASWGTGTAGLATPYWVRITRVGNTFKAERSPDGITWTQQGTTQTITMGSTIHVGLLVSARTPNAVHTATFDNVALVVPAPPVLAASGGTTPHTENVAVVVDSAITVTDPDSANMASGTVTVGTGYQAGQDVLAFTNQNGITGSWNAPTMTLTGSATTAQWQTALRSVTYNNTSNTPNTANRTINFVVNDATFNSNTAAKTVSVAAVNDAPVNTVPGAQTTAPNTAKVFSSGNGNLISIADVDAATVQVQLVSTNGTTTLSTLTGLTFSVGDGTADATMTFTGTIATVNTALAGSSFNPTTNFAGAASLQIVTSDLGATGTGGTRTDSDTITINVVEDLGIFTAHQDIGGPGIAGWSSHSAGTYTVSGSGADIWGTTDQFQYLYRTMTGDGRLTARVASETNTDNYAKAGVMFRSTLAANSIHASMIIPPTTSGTQMLTRTTTGGTTNLVATGGAVSAPYWVRITRSGDTYKAEQSVDGTTWVQVGTTQTITMGTTIYVGLAVTAHNNALLNTATFSNVTFEQPPVLAASGGTTPHTENVAVVVDSAITVTDLTSANMASGTVTVGAGYQAGQDVLAFTNQNGITGSWNAPTLTLTGSATTAQWQTALRSVTYNNTSNTPNTANRTINFVVYDATFNSNTAAKTVSVAAVNDAPVNTVPGAQATARNTAKVFSTGNGNLISISDVDAAGGTMQIQLVSTNGTTTLSTLTGLTFSVGDGTADATMTFTGSFAAVNTALAGLSFNPTTSFIGAASLQIVTGDQGNTGTGGTQTDNDTITITVTASYLSTITGTAGLLSHWRLGEATTSYDSFSGSATGSDLSAHTGEIGATWTLWQNPTPRGLMTNEGRLRRNNTTGGVGYLASATPASPDYLVEADIHVKATVATTDDIGITGRILVSDTNDIGTNYLLRYHKDATLAQWELRKNVGGIGTLLAVFPQSLTPGSSYRIGLDMHGSTIRMLVDGVVRGSVSDAAIAGAGRAGVRLGASTANATQGDTVGMHLDNFRVLPLLADSTATNNHGDYMFGPTLGVAGAITGDANTAVLFDGVNDYATVARQIANDFSIEFWFKSTQGIGTGAHWWSGAALVDAEVPGSANDFGVSLRSDGRVVAGTGPTDVSIVSTAGGYNNGSWHHVVFTRAMSTGALALYVDGVAAGSATGSTVSLSSPVNITFGRQQAGGYHLAGSLDEIAVYNTVLSGATVTDHYQLGASGGSDITGPTGGSVDASGLVGTGSRYAASTTLSLVLAEGTDPSGVAATGNLLKRATATLTSGGTANGMCGAFGAYATVTGGTDPVSPKSDTVTDQACYSYQYVVLDTLGNPTTYTSADIKVDLTAPAAPSLAHSAFTNAYWSSGAVVYYRSAAASGSFTTTSTATDTVSGIASHTFPTLGTNWTSTPGALGVNTYSWSGAPAAPGAKNVTATNNATVVSGNTSFTPTADDTAPSAGTVTPPNTTQASTSVSVAYTTGTDGGSGLGTRLLQRQSATLTGTTCGSYGGWTTVSTNPGSSPFGDTVTAGFCYKYQYVVADNVGNTHTATSTNVVKVTLPSSPLKAQYKNNEPAAPTDNSIQPHLQLVNTSVSGVDLSTITVRYWFTKEAGASTFNTNAWWATVGASNVTHSVVVISPRTGADAYLLVGFQPSTLAAGASSEVQLGFNKTDWSNFNEVGDYSYGTGTSYTDSTKVTVYQGGTLIWGTEP